MSSPLTGNSFSRAPPFYPLVSSSQLQAGELRRQSVTNEVSDGEPARLLVSPSPTGAPSYAASSCDKPLRAVSKQRLHGLRVKTRLPPFRPALPRRSRSPPWPGSALCCLVSDPIERRPGVNETRKERATWTGALEFSAGRAARGGILANNTAIKVEHLGKWTREQSRHSRVSTGANESLLEVCLSEH